MDNDLDAASVLIGQTPIFTWQISIFMLRFPARNKQIILYGIALALIIFILKWLEMRYVIIHEQLETYAGLIAVTFTLLGIWLTLKLRRPEVKTVIIEKPVYIEPNKDFIRNEKEAQRLTLSKRELEVLQLMAEGLSNQEIGEKLFVSLNTVKTHGTQIFEKLEVKRRTQAVDMGKKLGLIR